jgi:hypothetical protein
VIGIGGGGPKLAGVAGDGVSAGLDLADLYSQGRGHLMAGVAGLDQPGDHGVDSLGGLADLIRALGWDGSGGHRDVFCEVAGRERRGCLDERRQIVPGELLCRRGRLFERPNHPPREDECAAETEDGQDARKQGDDPDDLGRRRGRLVGQALAAWAELRVSIVKDASVDVVLARQLPDREDADGAHHQQDTGQPTQHFGLRPQAHHPRDDPGHAHLHGRASYLCHLALCARKRRPAACTDPTS